ncbi:asialoglycoprotein receptor-like 1 [Embiotoca jacksoni]|uniref:asialoglycoprotein receptor-like 1 n=1 Tax=Embiotoca jacksoni TaxID=100190 RepID=UPI0037042880
MESHYHQFGSPDGSSGHGERPITTQTAIKKIVIYILYCILVLLLLILLMVTGIKFSQLNKEITDVKHSLEKISHGRTSSLSTSGAATVPEAFFDKIVPVRGTCREGWDSFQGGCYLLSTNTVTWHQAEEHCKTQGGHLAVLNNVEKLDYISKIVEIRYSYWIGLVERQHEGHWSWVDGTDFNSNPTFWDKGQPDDWDYRENGEDCGQIHDSDRRKRKRWNDADCDQLFRYICETRA